MEKARARTSAEDRADTNEDENMEEEEDEMVTDKPILSAGTAISCLDELRHFALSHQSPELLDKSRTTTEKLTCNPKLSDFF